MSIFTPVNQVRLTNVSVVRYKKFGKRFELACYKNKVGEWRDKIETDIDNVLQTHTIFVNVSKGQTASEEDKDKVFGTKENDKIITEVIINTISKSALGYVDGVPAARHWLIPLKILCKKCIDLHLTILFDISTEMSKILAKGELQVSEKERSSAHEKILKEIALTIAQKCINPDTKRPYTVTMIEKAMNDIHFSVNPTKSAKLQALEIIKTLQAEYKDFKIQRAKMKIRIKAPSKEGKLIKEKIKDEAEELQDEFEDGRLELTCLIDPGFFKEITELVSSTCHGKGIIEVLSLNEVQS